MTPNAILATRSVAMNNQNVASFAWCHRGCHLPTSPDLIKVDDVAGGSQEDMRTGGGAKSGSGDRPVTWPATGASRLNPTQNDWRVAAAPSVCLWPRARLANVSFVHHQS